MIRLLKITLLLFAIVLSALLVFIATFDANRYKSEIVTAVKNATGRDLVINGELKLAFVDIPTILIEDVTYSNADWGVEPYLASMKRLELDVDLFPLLKNEIKLNRLTLVEPKIFLETNEEGLNNWQLTSQEDETTEETNEDDSSNAPFGLQLTEAIIEDALISYDDRTTDKNLQLVIDSLDINKISDTELSLALEGSCDDTPISLTGTSGRIVMWQANESFPIDLTLKVGDASIEAQGQIDEPLFKQTFAMQINAELERLQDLSTIAGTSLPDLPAITLATRLNRDENQISASELAATLGDSDIAGELSVDLSGDKPAISANLKSTLLDLIPLMSLENETKKSTGEVTASPAKAETKQEPSSPFAALQQLNADINIAVAELKTPEIEIENISLTALLQDGKLSVSPLSLYIAEGQIDGNLYIDHQTDKPSNIDSELTAQGIEITQLPIPFIQDNITGGQTYLILNLSTTGNTIEDLLQQAKGQLVFNTDSTKIKAADWSSEAELLSLTRLELDATFDSLPKGSIQINKLNLVEPQIQLETNLKGQGNWSFADETDQTDTKSEPINIQLNQLNIAKANVSFTDGKTKQTQQAAIDSLNIDRNKDSLNIDLAAIYRETPISLKGTTGLIARVINDNQFPIDLKLVANDANLLVRGIIDKPLSEQSVSLQLESSIKQLQSLSKLAEQDLPMMAPLTLKGQLDRTPTQVSVKKLNMKLGSSDLQGDISADLSGQTPFIKATLESKQFNLADLPQSNDADKSDKEDDKPKRLFPDDPILLDNLKKVNADIHISADKIVSNNLKINKTKLGAKLAEGRLSVEPFSSIIAEGKFNGDLYLDSQNQPAKLKTDLDIAGIDITQFGDLQKTVEGGKTDVSLKLEGSGNNISAIMGSANGKLLIQSGETKIKNIEGGLLTADILTALNPAADQQDDMNIKCTVVNFDIKDGIATAQNGIAAEAKRMDVTGSGTIDLGTEKLNIAIAPHAKEGLGVGVGELASLVSIGGTIMEPSPQANLKSALKTGLKVQTAVMTGGLSILAESLLEKATAEGSPCEVALGIIPTTSPQQDNTPEKAATEQ